MRIERDSNGDYVLDPDELAPKLCLSADELRDRMKSGLVTSLVEAGQGEDAGLCRLTVRFGKAVWRAIVSADGSVVREELGEQVRAPDRDPQSFPSPQKHN
jgi:uncharacterized protein DUF6522